MLGEAPTRGGSRGLSSERAQEAHFGESPGSALRGGSREHPSGWFRETSASEGSSQGEVTGTTVPILQTSLRRHLDAQTLRKEHGHAHGTPPRWCVAARSRWDRLDRARPGRAAPLLWQGRGRPAPTKDRSGGHDSVVADRDGVEPFGARRCLCAPSGVRPRNARTGASAPGRTAHGQGVRGGHELLREPRRRRPWTTSLRGGTVWTASRGTTHRTFRECSGRRGEPRQTHRLRSAHTGLRPRVSSRGSLLARDETVASTGATASAASLDGVIPQTDRRPMQNKPAYHAPRGVHSEGGKPARGSTPWERPHALTPCQSSLRGGMPRTGEDAQIDGRDLGFDHHHTRADSGRARGLVTTHGGG